MGGMILKKYIQNRNDVFQHVEKPEEPKTTKIIQHLETDINEIDSAWALKLDNIIEESPEAEIKQNGKEICSILSNIIYLLLNEKESNDFGKNHTNSGDLQLHKGDTFRLCNQQDKEIENQIEKLTDGLDPQYFDEGLNIENLIMSTKITQTIVKCNDRAYSTLPIISK
ncbi:hypothetical protein TRFO_40276 [Tritrichomonas foetus]|uniref:Uncharacterized protein n=1 Tax=Tritrichomonas foetus TaxID=1144522 RepID=A0A1J4J1Q0_9EUKA|nr:hypothetical protein TRFO_40276 [Tritrichomonas foetus]|eukprot:OHS93454.1 hypothetical protein TRFO_40276 [Tritrichomonas foetus]